MNFLVRNNVVNQSEADEVFKELTWHLAGALQKAMPVSRRARPAKTRSKPASGKPRLRAARSTSAAVSS